MSQVCSPLCGDKLVNYDHQARVHVARMYNTWGDLSFSQQCSWRHKPSGTWRFLAFRGSYYL